MDLMTSPASKVRRDRSWCNYYRFNQSFYSNTSTSFEYGNALTDAQSPAEFATAHNAAVTGATIAVEVLMKIKSFQMPKKQRITKITGWLSATAAKTSTIA